MSLCLRRVGSLCLLVFVFEAAAHAQQPKALHDAVKPVPAVAGG